MDILYGETSPDANSDGEGKPPTVSKLIRSKSPTKTAAEEDGGSASINAMRKSMGKPTLDQGEITRELGQTFVQRPATMDGQARKKNLAAMKTPGTMVKPSLKGSPPRNRDQEVNLHSTFSGSVGFNT